MIKVIHDDSKDKIMTQKSLIKSNFINNIKNGKYNTTFRYRDNFTTISKLRGKTRTITQNVPNE
jgi:hypothetical protein